MMGVLFKVFVYGIQEFYEVMQEIIRMGAWF